jgi:hypothetical protein
MRALFAALLVACAAGEPHVVRSDVGQACMFPDADAALQYRPPTVQVYAAGAQPVITVGSFGCSTCDRDQQAWCEVTRDGDVLRVATLSSWIEWDGACSREVCGLRTSCDVPALDAGTYTLVLGSASTTVAVPSQREQPPCVTAD